MRIQSAVFLLLISSFATSSSHAATTGTQNTSSTPLRGSSNSRIRGVNVNKNKISDNSSGIKRRILRDKKVNGPNTKPGTQGLRNDVDDPNKISGKTVNGPNTRPGTNGKLNGVDDPNKRHGTKRQGLRDRREKGGIKNVKLEKSIQTIPPITKPVIAVTTTPSAPEPSSVPTPIPFDEAVSLTESPTVSPVVAPTPRPTWTFPTQSPTQETVEVCEYCSNRCFDDNAVVQFTQSSSATCAQVRTRAPSLTLTQCKLDRSKIEESCCCSPSIVDGRLDGDGDINGSACSFCVGNNFVDDNQIIFSNGDDTVSCSGLRALVRVGLNYNFCAMEKIAIEAACCEEFGLADAVEVEADVDVDVEEVEVDVEEEMMSSNNNVTDDMNNNNIDNNNVWQLYTPEEFAAFLAERPSPITDGSENDQEQPAVVFVGALETEAPAVVVVVAEEEPSEEGGGGPDEEDTGDKNEGGGSGEREPATIKDGGKREVNRQYDPNDSRGGIGEEAAATEASSATSGSNSGSGSSQTASSSSATTEPTISSRFDDPLYDPNHSRNDDRFSDRTTGTSRIPMFDRKNAISSF